MAFGWDDAAKIAGPALGIVAGIGAGKRQIKQQKMSIVTGKQIGRAHV